MSIFVLCLGVGLALAAWQLTTTQHYTARASISENILGWIWADPIGWISVNSDTPAACPLGGCGSYGVNFNLLTKKINGWAWSDSVGWLCFGTSCIAVSACAGVPPTGVLDAWWEPGTNEVHGWAKVCSAGADGWVSLNCVDAPPGACVPFSYKVLLHDGVFTPALTSPGSSFAWNGTSAGTGFGYLDFSKVFIRLEAPPYCSDGIDNDLNGKTDCAEPACCVTSACSSSPVCVAPPPPPPPSGSPTAWILAKAGSVYAQQGISAIGTPSVASYCLTTQGKIEGFTSGSGCSETGSSAPALNLPKSSTGYKGTLGSLDIAGILSGRYGPVLPVSSSVFLPEILNGSVYVAKGDVTIAATTFRNGSALGTSLQRGNGLLIVDGGNLTITGNLSYKDEGLPKALRSLASFGVIVKRKNPPFSGPPGGSIIIKPSVTKVVGAYFAEDTIATGSAGASDSQLQVFGLMAARQFNLQRNYASATEPAELFTFDGRAIVNPPPGMYEVSKSLPTSRDAF